MSIIITEIYLAHFLRPKDTSHENKSTDKAQLDALPKACVNKNILCLSWYESTPSPQPPAKYVTVPNLRPKLHKHKQYRVVVPSPVYTTIFNLLCASFNESFPDASAQCVLIGGVMQKQNGF